MRCSTRAGLLVLAFSIWNWGGFSSLALGDEPAKKPEQHPGGPWVPIGATHKTVPETPARIARSVALKSQVEPAGQAVSMQSVPEPDPRVESMGGPDTMFPSVFGANMDGGDCAMGDCGACLPCGKCGNFWFRGEYLLWWIDEMDTPPLVTSSPEGTPQGVAGVLGEPTTNILFGGGQLDSQSRSGARFTLGHAFGDGCWAIEGSYLFLARRSHDFSATSQGDPVLARPFFNVETGLNDAFLIAFDDLIEGTVAVDASTRLDSGEIYLRRTISQGCGVQWDVLAGYRYGRLEDDLQISSDTLDTGGAAPGTTIDLVDRFSSTNDFNGAQVGTMLTYRRCCWTLELLAKLAVGNTHTQVTIDGSTVTTDIEGATTTDPFGLLARPTNIGVFEQNDFSVMPELGATLGYDITKCLKATVGYRLLYWSKVGRAGDQIDLDLNLSEPLVGTPRPVYDFTSNDFWAHGLNFGLEYRY